MNKPAIFIGSSSEGEPIAYAIQENLENVGDIYVWTQGVFELGSSYLESLIKELDKADFAILVLTEDDITISRNQETVSPRDNVLFELGLFMGRLGRNRSFFVYDKDKNIKIPSDLSGISGAGYKLQQSGNLAASLGAACNKIRIAVNNAGIRPKFNMKHMDAYTKRLEFCNKITGYWWEHIKPDTNSALSFVSIEYDEDILILNMKGRTFDTKGNYTAYWETKSTGIHFEEQKVFYNWVGWFPSRPSEPFEGVGEIKFYGEEGILTEGNGIFSNINIADIKSIEKSSFELSRSNEAEIDIMYSKDKEKIARLIVEKIGKMF
ncbi:MAG TPA: nucleotide-binding protein [Chitinophagaceae bacterium]|nr:nucleotide-binding protein [Chitinophagaceae bacterium]